MILKAELGCWYGKVSTLEELIECWEAGKDFQERSYRYYFSNRDTEQLKQDGYTGVEVSGYGLVATF